jgi:LysR family transcriptional regulator, low CO2-responsive transcriptional regulator
MNETSNSPREVAVEGNTPNHQHWNLRVFCEVAEQQSITRAAEQLMMSQPGVSMVVHRLERQYKVPLLDHIGKRIFLTEAGIALYRHALTTLKSARELEVTVSAIKRGNAGSVTFAGTAALTNDFMPALLAEFHTHHSSAEIQMMTIRHGTSVEELLETGPEFAVMPRRSAGVGRKFVIEPFRREPVIVVAGPSHPLAAQPVVTPQELAQHPFIYFSRDSERISLLEERLRLGDDSRIHVLMEVTIESTKKLVQLGVGLAAIFRMAVEDELERGDLVELNIPELDLYDDLVLVYQRERHFSLLAKDLMDLIRSRGPRGQEYAAATGRAITH